jgi:hypothetical protein
MSQDMDEKLLADNRKLLADLSGLQTGESEYEQSSHVCLPMI